MCLWASISLRASVLVNVSRWGVLVCLCWYTFSICGRERCVLIRWHAFFINFFLGGM